MSLAQLADGLGLSVGSVEVRGGDGASQINVPEVRGANAAPPVQIPSTKEGRSAQYRELTEKRKSLFAELDGLANRAKSESRALDPEAEARFNLVEDEIRGVDTRLTALEAAMQVDDAEDQQEMNSLRSATGLVNRVQSLRNRPERVERRTNNLRPGAHFAISRDLDDKRAKRDQRNCLSGWFKPEAITDEIRESAHRMNFSLSNNRITFRLFESNDEREERADMSTTAGYGGNTVATVLTDYIQVALKAANPLLDVANVFRTSQGNPLKLPTIDDTGTDASLGAEGTAPSASEIADSSKTFNSYRMERLIKSSNELLRDTSFADLPATIGKLLGLAVGRKMAAYIATGTGSSQPEGIVTGSAAGITAASATAITYNELIRLIYSLDVAYLPNSKFFMNPAVWSALLQLQDGFGRPLIGDTQDPTKPNIKGYPVILMPGMASSIATTAKTILFGDPQYFGIRLVGDFELLRFNELYGAAYQTGFMGVQFFDSKVTLSAAIKRITQA